MSAPSVTASPAAHRPAGRPAPSHDRPPPQISVVRPPPPPPDGIWFDTLGPILAVLVPGVLLLGAGVMAGADFAAVGLVMLFVSWPLAVIIGGTAAYHTGRDARVIREMNRVVAGLPPATPLEQSLSQRWIGARRRLEVVSVRGALRAVGQHPSERANVVLVGVPSPEANRSEPFPALVWRVRSRVLGWLYAWLALVALNAWLIVSGRFSVPGMHSAAVIVLLVAAPAVGVALWSFVLGVKWLRLSPGRVELIYGGLRSGRPTRTFEMVPGTIALVYRSLNGSWLELWRDGCELTVRLPRQIRPIHRQVVQALVSTALIPPADTEQL